MKILCITPINHIPGIKNALSSIGDLTIVPDPSNEDIKKMNNDYDVIFTNPNKSKIFIGEELFSEWRNLCCVCTASTGTVHIDKKFLAQFLLFNDFNFSYLIISQSKGINNYWQLLQIYSLDITNLRLFLFKNFILLF